MKKSKQDIFAKFNADNWNNVMTGIGNAKVDKMANGDFVQCGTISDAQLSDLYRGEGIGKKIVDIPAEDMVRRWFSVEGDTENAVNTALDKIYARSAMKKALKWSRLFGGSLMVLGIDDGNSFKSVLESPLNFDRIRKFSFIRVYDRREVTWEQEDIDTDPRSDNFGLPKLFTIKVPNIDNSRTEFKVHYTRCIRFLGEDLPNKEKKDKKGWGDSVLQSVFIRLRGFGKTLIATEAIIEEFIVGVLTINNLAALLSNNKGKAVIDRLQMIDQAKHVLNTMLVDKDEDYQRISASVNGIKDILEFLKDVISAVSGIPQVKLFGEQSKGIGGGSEGNIRMYYDGISERQEEELRNPCEYLVKIMVAAEKLKIKNDRIVFYPLWAQDEKEQSETRLNNAKAADIYLSHKVLMPEEVANSVFGGDSYSDTIKLDPKRKTMEPSPQTEKVNKSTETTQAKK